MSDTLLCVKNLTVSVGDKRILSEVSFDVQADEILALVGGSGSGKSTTALAVMGLLPVAMQMSSGTVLFEGAPVVAQMRGKKIGMVFQEPLFAFNPVFTIGAHIDEVLRYHTSLKTKQRRERIAQLLDLVGLPDPLRIVRSYPHQLSGGMRQRAMIAQALAAEPALLIADEPTSNLDVTLQAKIMGLFCDLQKKLGFSMLLISHDLGMVAHLVQRAAVMQHGCIVEAGEIDQLVTASVHPYTQALMDRAKDA